MAYDCTGVSARWCPVHGDCTCKDAMDLNDGDCPLHSESSDHGEPEIHETAWGTFYFRDEDA